MTPRRLKQYLLSLPDAEEVFPFGPDAAVYKVQGKVFALVYEMNGHLCINLKCDPAEARELRDVFSAVIPAWHMNKKHWNTVILDGSLPDGEIERMIDNSWHLVVRGFRKAIRTGLETRFAIERRR